MTINKLTPEFTKEQLIEHANEVSHTVRVLIESKHIFEVSEAARMNAALIEIALAALNAPDDVPPHVLDAMSDMCDAGFDAQGIWDLCRESIMPPKPCPRCGTKSDRPDGGHYCHAGVKNDN